MTGLTVLAVPSLRDGPTTADDGRASRLVRWSVIAVLAVSVAVRFFASGPLWLDEAQTVNIAHRSVPHLFTALREDGAPPLYYLVLHYWMAAFGTGTITVRSLSGIFSVAAIPLMAVVARRYRLVEDSPWPAVLLLATCPFAVYYATETRMYSFELLLTLLAMIAYERFWTLGGWRYGAAAAVTTGALVLTQYWALFLGVTVGGWAIIAGWRYGVPTAKRLLIPLIVGGLAFVPWLPSFIYQSRHTGAPWGSPPGIELPLVALGSWTGLGLTSPGTRLAYYIMIALALVGYARAGDGFAFRRPVRRRPLLLLGLVVSALLVATIASEVSRSAYAPRYSTIVLAPLLLVVASGFGVMSPRVREIALPVVVVFGLVSCAFEPFALRTQAGQVARVLRLAGPHDLVVFCPDQLGPAVNRIAPHAGTQVVYPTFGSPAMIDWVNYKKRNESADPIEFAYQALQRARGHTIWYVYDQGYPTLAGGCLSLFESFTAARGTPYDALNAHGAFEVDHVAEFAPAASS